MTKSITVGGRDFQLHPCPAIGLQAIGANFTKIGTSTEAGLDALVDGIYYGVKRGAQGDAAVTREFFAWNIDATNVLELTQAFAEVNGASPKPAGEAPGEA